MPERVLWRNPLARSCPYCWFGEPCSLDQRRGTDGRAHLKDHLMREHRGKCVRYAATLGLKDGDAGAWALVREARYRPPPPLEATQPHLAEALRRGREPAPEPAPVLVEVPLPK